MTQPLTRAYDFDDLLLVPVPSRINSRDDVDLTPVSKIGSVKLPIMASPMKGIVGNDLVIGLGKLGGLGIMHRFYDGDSERFHDVSEIKTSGVPFGIAVGLNDEFYHFALDAGADLICIDVANGYLNSVLEFTHKVADYISSKQLNTKLMVGNVVTKEGTRRLLSAGANVIRVGIGAGQLCTTRNNTGIGYPQLSAIENCLPIGHEENYITVADGGIRNSGDAVKALAMGADYVMLGSYLAKANESENNGTIYGMASRKIQEEYHQMVKSVEGIEKIVHKEMPLTDLLSEFVANLKSAFTYLNAKNIQELWDNADFIEVSPSAIDHRKEL